MKISKHITKILFVGSLVCAFSSGMSRGCHHATRDFPHYSKAEHWIPYGQYWSVGGKERWNQSYPWSADFAHQMMHFQVIGLVLAGFLFAMYVAYKKTELKFTIWTLAICYLWMFLAWYIEGRGFTLLYHVVLPDDPSVSQYTFIVWLVGWFIP